jgi:hypothetical protein
MARGVRIALSRWRRDADRAVRTDVRAGCGCIEADQVGQRRERRDGRDDERDQADRRTRIQRGSDPRREQNEADEGGEELSHHASPLIRPSFHANT